jgi:thioesterase domain-containing protein
VGADLTLLVPLQPEGPAQPVFCVHAVSGSALTYLPLARLLGPRQPVYGLEAPGLDSARPPVPSLPALAAEYVEILREVQPGDDYRLLGWSMGGAIAFEMARLLTDAGATVSKLILIDVLLSWFEPLPPERAIAHQFLVDLSRVVGDTHGAVVARLAPVLDGLPADADAPAVFDAVERARLLPEEIDAELMLDRYRVFRANVEAIYAYAVTGTYPGSAIHLMAEQSAREHMRWSTVIADLAEVVVPGDHHSIWTGDGLGLIGKAVSEYLLSVR